MTSKEFADAWNAVDTMAENVVAHTHTALDLACLFKHVIEDIACIDEVEQIQICWADDPAGEKVSTFIAEVITFYPLFLAALEQVILVKEASNDLHDEIKRLWQAAETQVQENDCKP